MKQSEERMKEKGHTRRERRESKANAGSGPLDEDKRRDRPTQPFRPSLVVPAQQTEIAQLPRPDEVSCSEEDAEQDTEASRCNVRRTEEQRPPADPCHSRKDNGLGSLEHRHRVV